MTAPLLPCHQVWSDQIPHYCRLRHYNHSGFLELESGPLQRVLRQVPLGSRLRQSLHLQFDTPHKEDQTL